MWQYFSQLYKHANKGIKGRGKDRRISVTGVPESTAFSFASSAEAMSAMVATAPAPLLDRADRGYSVQANASITNSCCSSPYQPHHEQPQPLGDYKYVVG
jgi:hypothetical protein